MKKMDHRVQRQGWTLIELMVVTIVISLIVVPLVRFFTSSMKETVKVKWALDSQDALRYAMREIERDFTELKQLDITKLSEIQFRMDSHRVPGYDRNGDPDGDGIPNYMDPDRDNDYGRVMPATDRWTVGLNVSDDDQFDDTMNMASVSTDKKIDVQCRYFIQDGSLVRDYNYHETGWGKNETVLVKSLATDGFIIHYFGNVNQPLGMKIDLGDDGTAGSKDSGEGDRIISEREIDYVKPPLGNGDKSGSIDNLPERQYVFFLSIRLAQDANKDKIEDFSLQTEISPPLLPVRRSLL